MAAEPSNRHSLVSRPALSRGTAARAFAWFLLSLGLYWLGNGGHSLWDRDEPRYAVATREMIAGGDWIVPYFNSEYRFDKPILIYWLMSVPMRCMGVNEFSARAVAGLAGAMTIALIFLLALRMGANREGAHVAALATLFSPLLMVISKASTTDAVLVLSVVAALFLHWRQRREGFSWVRHLLFWVVIGLSILEKGPPGPMVVALAVVGERFWRWMSPGDELLGDGGPGPRPPGSRWADAGRSAARTAAGLGVLLAVTLPWAWAATIATEGEFFRVAIGRHVIERASRSLESHGGPVVYYIPVLLLTTFPLTAFALASWRWGWSARRAAALRLLWCWIVPSFIVFSLAKTKLPHYIAPLLPAVALMIGLWWSARTQPDATVGVGEEIDKDVAPVEARGVGPARPAAAEWRKTGSVATALFGLIAAAALPVAAWFGPFPALMPPGAAMGGLILVSSWGGAIFWWRRRERPAVALSTCGFAAALLAAFLWGLPALEPLRPSKPLARWVRANAPVETELMAVDFQEPSLVFYWQGHVDMTGKNEEDAGLTRLADLGRPLALVTTESRWQRWLEQYKGIVPPEVSVRFQQKYYLFQKGRWERLVIVGNWPTVAGELDTPR